MELRTKLSQTSSDVVVPTDKTNGHRSVNLNNYISWVQQHMREAAPPHQMPIHCDTPPLGNQLCQAIGGHPQQQQASLP
eukprot:10562184-Ditylum_brightwellii.AAC.1